MPELAVLAGDQFETRNDDEAQKLTDFKLTITTPDIDGAGTDANVYVQVDGVDYLMDLPNYNDFERGDTDHYQFRFPNGGITLGQLRAAEIRLHHDNDGRNPGWYCGSVVLFVQYDGSSRMRKYKEWGPVGWLARDEGPYYTTEAVLQHGTPIGG